MRKILLLIAITLPITAYTDDSKSNPIGKKLKAKITKTIKTSPISGYCDLYVEMTHTESVAIVKRVTTSGDYHLCKLSKSAVKKGQRFKYRSPEKFIRLHIVK